MIFPLFTVGVFRIRQYGCIQSETLYRFNSAQTAALGLVMLAKAKQLSVAAQKLINIIAVLGQRDAEISFLDIRFMRADAVDCADVRCVFFA